MRMVTALLAALGLPAIAVGLGLYPYWADGMAPNAMVGCLTGQAEALLGATGGSAGDCMGNQGGANLALAGLITGGVGAALVLGSAFLALVFGVHRLLLAYLFQPVAFIGVVLAGLVATAHIGLVGGIIWFIEHVFIGAYTNWLFALLAVGAVLVGGRVMWRALHFYRPFENSMIALPAGKFDQPRLALMVRRIAERIGARPPEHIVLGFEPTFFVMNGRMHTPFSKKPLKGEILYLSVPMMRALSRGELTAIIGHELGHFAGGDTAFSRRFAPIYRGLIEAQETMRGEGFWALRWLTLPARAIVAAMIDAFSRAERRIGRGRERRADAVGVQASSPEDLAYSLLKSSILGGMWYGEVEHMLHRVSKGRYSRNLSRNFIETLRHDLDRTRIAPYLELALEEQMSHPTDTHPTTRERIELAGLNVDAVVDEEAVLARFFAHDPVSAELDDMENLEETLSHAIQHIALQTGATTAPEEEDIHEYFLSLMNAFLAHMVTADGVVDDREIETAEKTASQWISDFDAVGFRERCRHPDELPSVDDLIDRANSLLKPGGAEELKKTLLKVAEADGELHAAEKALLDRLEIELKGSDPEAESRATVAGAFDAAHASAEAKS